MGNISLLALLASYDALRGDLNHVQIRLEGRPITAALAPSFALAQSEVEAVFQQEQQLLLNVARAEVRAILAEEDVEGCVDAVVHGVLTITGNSRKDPLFLHFVVNTTPAQIKDLALAGKLVTVKAWIPSLLSSPHPSLVALAPRLAQAVQVGEQRQHDLAAADQALKDFREVGPRKALVDRTNALRVATYGKLGELVHAHPELRLPRDFADRFFKHERRNRKPAKAKEVAIAVEAARAELSRLEAKHVKALADEATAAANQARARAAKDKKVLDKAQKKVDDAAARLAAVKGELGQ
jgi:hypothetical protein